MFMPEIKICIKNIGEQHSLEKNETATMFFSLKTFSSLLTQLPLMTNLIPTLKRNKLQLCFI